MAEQFSKIRFVMVKDLSLELKKISPIQNGLVAVATSVTSLPKDKVLEVGTSPSEFIDNLAVEQGVSIDLLGKRFANAFDED